MVAIPLLARLGQRLSRKLEVRRPLDPLADRRSADGRGRACHHRRLRARSGSSSARCWTATRCPISPSIWTLPASRRSGRRKAGLLRRRVLSRVPARLRHRPGAALVITLDTLNSIEAVVSAARRGMLRHHHRRPGPRRRVMPPSSMSSAWTMRCRKPSRPPPAERSGAERYRSTDGPRDRVDPRAAGRVQGDPPKKNPSAIRIGSCSRRVARVGKSSPSAVAEQATQVDG